MDIKLRFESNGKKIEVGSNESFRLLNIDGIETGSFELFTTSNASYDGSKVSKKKIVAKPIAVEVKYVGLNREEERRNVISFFNIHNKGRLIVQINNIVKAINYEIESFNINQDNINNPLKFLVSLYCPDPFFRDLTERKEEVAIWRGSFCFPLCIPQEGIIMGFREPSLIVNVLNDGHVKTGMRIRFKALASLSNPSLFNVNTREYFKIFIDMEKGDIITVNTNKFQKRVELEKDGIISNVFNWIDLKSKFLQLDVGDNLFRYDADEGLDNLEVDIYYNHGSLGV